REKAGGYSKELSEKLFEKKNDTKESFKEPSLKKVLATIVFHYQHLRSYASRRRSFSGNDIHGIEERGVYRIHQFEKQEMIVVCKPEESMEWYEKLW
ncbi:hypothetical protein PZH31_19710, partial [[Ruminococcus] torques]|nr:hypothetical protein [[Ruminococcus] torques]